jgi:putative cardiolipin synthase
VGHSGYIKWRKPLLRAGIHLYEMRLVSSVERARGVRAGPFGSGASSLLAKTFAVDRERLFVGSFNFDPRSANLNTELGFVIDSPVLANRLETTFDDRVPELAYEVGLSPAGDVIWIERRGGKTVRHDTEPGTTLLQRASVRFVSWWPIDWLL